jgi:uncharacterized membrane protein YhaH (DUF805 family)
VSFAESIRTVFSKYATFDGVAPLSEYWWFVLFTWLGQLALNSLNVVTGRGTIFLGASLTGAFGIVVLLPLLAVTIRRLRDVGRRWTELFWLLLPIAGVIVLIVHLAERTPSRPLPPVAA